MEPLILIVEDDDSVRESLVDMLSAENYGICAVRNGAAALEKLAEKTFDAAIVDLRLPDMTGLELIRKSRELTPNLDFLLMTGFATIESVIEALRMGASDYLTKPINDDQLKSLLTKIFSRKSGKPSSIPVDSKSEAFLTSFHQIIGEDAKMQKIYSIIEAISDTDTTVLLKGESGTGKGLIAQAIHYSNPTRKDKPYIEVSCGAIPTELLESELFGHVKGAFTSAVRDRVGRFELANGGTILLDEIDSLTPVLQVKLLRVLQQKVFEMVGDTKTKRVDVRIIAATNRNLHEEIKKGHFREDLYYRLNVITIEVPPLRERKSDIHTLVRHFIAMFNEKTKRNVKGISKEAMKMITDYDWPGNVRELENTLERVVVLSQSDVIDLHDLPEHIVQKATVQADVLSGAALKDILKEPEKKILMQALERAGGNRKKAARLLNISRTTFYNKIKEHQLL